VIFLLIVCLGIIVFWLGATIIGARKIDPNAYDPAHLHDADWYARHNERAWKQLMLTTQPHDVLDREPSPVETIIIMER